MIIDYGDMTFSHNNQYLIDNEDPSDNIFENIPNEIQIQNFWKSEIDEYDDIVDVKEMAREDIFHLLSIVKELKEENMILENEKLVT